MYPPPAGASRITSSLPGLNSYPGPWNGLPSSVRMSGTVLRVEKTKRRPGSLKMRLMQAANWCWSAGKYSRVWQCASSGRPLAANMLFSPK